MSSWRGILWWGLFCIYICSKLSPETKTGRELDHWHLVLRQLTVPVLLVCKWMSSSLPCRPPNTHSSSPISSFKPLASSFCAPIQCPPSPPEVGFVKPRNEHSTPGRVRLVEHNPWLLFRYYSQSQSLSLCLSILMIYLTQYFKIVEMIRSWCNLDHICLILYLSF